MNHQNPTRPSRKQRKQGNLPSQNGENASDRMQARMNQVIVEGELDYNHDPMEEEINQDPTEESPQKPEANNGRNDEEYNEFSQEEESDLDSEESFGVGVEIVIPAADALFDSSSPAMEEEIRSELDEAPHDKDSTAESGVYVPPEESPPRNLYHLDPYGLKMIEEVLDDPVDLEKELGESKVWKELREKEKVEVKDFLAGYNMNGKTRGFLGIAFDLALSMEFSSYGMPSEGGDVSERGTFMGISEGFG